MVRIAQISDLHFGHHDPALVPALRSCLQHLAPDLVALSGDLTQNARRGEFAAAADFLAGLPRPLLVVPGNHDLPGWRPFHRFIQPWRRWREGLNLPTEDCARGPGHLAIGINTARRWQMRLDWSRGRIDSQQLDRIDALVADAQPDQVRILVAHHPFLLTEVARRRGLIGQPREVRARMRAADLDLILGGHLHLAFAGTAAGCVVSQAGTAISTRLKGEPNGFNLIEATRADIRVEFRAWNGHEFVAAGGRCFRRGTAGWEEGAG